MTHEMPPEIVPEPAPVGHSVPLSRLTSLAQRG
jgi:hypothetical protein